MPVHEAVREYVRGHLPEGFLRVVEVGSLDINGGLRDLVQTEPGNYLGVDLQEGPGVDVVADFAEWTGLALADLVLCCEVLEHTAAWREIVAAAARTLVPGGTFIVTCATTGRRPHSARSAGPIQPGEFYENVAREDLAVELGKHFTGFEIDVAGTDLRATAVR